MYWAERLVQSAVEEDLRKAVALAPNYADAWARLGALLERRGDSGEAAKALERAVELNPYDANAWVDLGLHRELEGDAKKAEECLLKAARNDNTFFPRWVLANFYLRHGAGDPFWTAMREAISRNREDLSAAFELYWRAFDDAREILEKGVPDTPEINRRYFIFLLRAGRTAAIEGVWKRQAGRLAPEDVFPALQYVDQLLANGREAVSAAAVWNRLCEAGLLRYQPLDPNGGRLLTNGKFAIPPSGRGFDWKFREIEGIRFDVVNTGGRSSLLIRFSGAHPEVVELVSQVTLVQAHQSHRLHYSYSTSGLPPDTGLYWTVEDAEARTKLTTSEPLAATEENWKEQQETFQSGAKTRLLRVVFAYRRSPGTTRAQGSVLLSDVELSPASPHSQRGAATGAVPATDGGLQRPQ